jgi:gliding motility-associated-like protein
MVAIDKHLLTAFLWAFITLAALAQPSNTVITPEHPTYQNLKEQGLVPQDAQGYIPTGGQGLDPVFAQSEDGEKQTTQCNCLQNIDNTFQVVPFTNSSGPNYRNDDGSSPVVNLPFTFCLYGNNYTSLYINNNGNVSFGTSYGTFSSSSFPSASYTMVAPFWADVDTRNNGSGLVYYKVTPTHIIVRWRNVGYFSSQADKTNDFQLILTNGNDTIIPLGTNVSFCYGDMQWTTGSASGGSGGFGGTPATVGANKGDGVAFAQFGRFNAAGTAYDGPFGASDQVSWLDNRTFFFNTCTNNNNIAPIPTGLSGACDTSNVCPGDVLNFNFQFLSPEQNQTTTTVINPNGVPNFSGTATTGNISTVTATFAPDSTNVGYNVLQFVATDNAVPPASTIIEIVVYVQEPPMRPVITGDSLLCPGEVVTLSATQGYFNYTWAPNGEITDNIQVNAVGVYTVTVDSGGCEITSNPFTVIQLPTPAPTISNPIANCVTGLSTISGSPGYVDYLWTPGNLTNDTVDVSLGNYTLTVTDTNGCVGSSTIQVAQVLQITASLLQSTNASCVGLCDGTADIDVQNAIGAVTYAWTPNLANTANGTNLCAGNYDVIVSDNSGCADTVSFAIGSNSQISTQVTTTNLDCFNTCNGEITITPLQGQAPFDFVWLPNVSSLANNNTLCAGQYIIQTIDAYGCVATDTVTLTAPAEFRGVTAVLPETCPNFCDGTASVSLSGGVQPYSVVWNPGNILDSIATNLCGGLYDYTATDANGCVETGSAAVPTLPPPTAMFSSNAAQANVLEPTVEFYDASTADVVNWQWDFTGVGSSTAQNPVQFFPGPGSFPVTLIVTNGYGCTDTVISDIYIAEVKTLYIPNAFTPNSDGKNETFRPQGMLGDNADFEMIIFDRWGQKMFVSRNIANGWDGTFKGNETCLVDIYIYKVTVTDKTTGLAKVYWGHVSLLE